MIFPVFNTFAEASSEQGIGALGFDGSALLIQLVTFVLVFLVLKRFAFEPILRVLKERRETIDSGITLGEQMKKERAELESQIEAKLQDAVKEADGIIARAEEAAKTTVREAEEKAKTKAADVLKDAENRITQDAARARQSLEKEMAGLVADATEAIIQEKVDVKKDAELIQRALKGAA